MELNIGQTIQTATWRVHRYNGAIVAQSLLGAGKRGKRCAKLYLQVPMCGHEGDNYSHDVASIVARYAAAETPVDRMREILGGFPAMHGLWFQFSESEVRGVDLCAGPEIIINAAKVYIRCDGVDFSVRGKDDVNEPSLMPEVRSKGQGARFYAWLKAFDGDFDTLDFRQLKTLMMNAGIKVHYWLVLD